MWGRCPLSAKIATGSFLPGPVALADFDPDPAVVDVEPVEFVLGADGFVHALKLGEPVAPGDLGLLGAPIGGGGLVDDVAVLEFSVLLEDVGQLFLVHLLVDVADVQAGV